MMLHSEVAEIEMTGFTGRETGTEKETEIVIGIENVTETVIVIGTETEGKTAGTRTEVQILVDWSLCVRLHTQLHLCITKSS
jgi:hypothetical protein